MNTVATVNPVDILRDIEERCRASASDLPHKADAGNEWSGIGFRIGDNYLVTQLGEAVEILDVPAMSRVPLTRPWVLGVANVRGNLLPVVDVQGMLSGTMTQHTARARVLVFDHDGLFSGLLVDEVLGLKHFNEGEYTDETVPVDDFLQPYTEHGFRRGGRVWSIFSLYALVDAPQFLQAAV